MARLAAACIEYTIDITDVAGSLVLQSGIAWPDFFLIGSDEKDPVLNEPVFQHLAECVKSQNLDVVMFDPLQDMSHADETNQVFRALGQRLRRFASESRVSVALVHHTRKVAPGFSPSIDDARGGSALRGTSRFNRVLVSMSDEQVVHVGVDDARFFFRIGDVESNLAPPSSAKNRWFEKCGVELPNGQNVGTLTKWTWPDVFDGITPGMAVRAREELEQLEPIDAKQSTQANAWFGFVVARICGIEFPPDKKLKEYRAARARVVSILTYGQPTGGSK